MKFIKLALLFSMEKKLSNSVLYSPCGKISFPKNKNYFAPQNYHKDRKKEIRKGVVHNSVLRVYMSVLCKITNMIVTTTISE
jgi:hypothetical protein